jgi:hypothetical protein
MGSTSVNSEKTLTWLLSNWSLPQLIASEGVAPASLASYSMPVFTNTPRNRVLFTEISSVSPNVRIHYVVFYNPSSQHETTRFTSIQCHFVYLYHVLCQVQYKSFVFVRVRKQHISNCTIFYYSFYYKLRLIL